MAALSPIKEISLAFCGGRASSLVELELPMYPVLCKVHPSSSQHCLAVTASGKSLGSDHPCPPTASPVLPAAAVFQLRRLFPRVQNHWQGHFLFIGTWTHPDGWRQRVME